jgi:hypothetical protein
MDNCELCFWPWKGARYDTDPMFGIKILVMGESTYYSDDGPEVYKRQRKAMEDMSGNGPGWFAHYNLFAYQQGKWNDPFGAGWISTLLGKRAPALHERQVVLDSVAFWNYADGPPLCAARREPPKEYLENANRKLECVIAKLKPDAVILFSRTPWQDWLARGFDCDPEVGCAKPTKVSVNGHTLRLLWSYHPSAAGQFNQHWCEVLKAVRSLFPNYQAPEAPRPAGTRKARPPGAVHRIVLSKPYGAWLFDDGESKCQPFVHSITDIIDELSRAVPNARSGFALQLSGGQFEGADGHIELIESPPRRRVHLYRMAGKGLEGCMCGNTLDSLFGGVPQKIFYRVSAGQNHAS